MARILKIPHIGCLSHKLNIDVNEMLKSNKSMTMTLNSVPATINQCRRRLRNRDTLRNINDLTPVLPCETIWSEYARMISRYNRLRKELMIVAEDENTDLRINTTPQFYRNDIIIEKKLEEINFVVMESQREHLSLSHCRFSVDTLLEAVSSGKGLLGNPSCCSFGVRHSSSHGRIPSFCLAVAGIC